MTSSTPLLDAHDHQLTQAFTEFVVRLDPQDLLEIGCEDSVAAEGLRAAGRLVRCVALDALPLEDADGSVDVVLLRDVLSTAANPCAAAAEAWRVARRCVMVAETEYLGGVRSQARMKTLAALINDVRIARGFPPVHPLGVGEVLSVLREEPAAVDVRGFGALTIAPPDEVDALIEAGLGDFERSGELEARVRDIREAAARGEISYAGSRVVIAYKAAPVSTATGAAPDPVATAEGEVTLREITPDGLRAAIRLHPAPAQQRFVAPNTASLAQAAVTPHAWHRAIDVGETTVGFVMVSTDPGEDDSPYLWRFMIDARHQGRGAGRRALELVCEHFAAEGATALHCAIVEGPGSPRAFYEAQGFVATGKIDHGEIVLRRPLG